MISTKSYFIGEMSSKNLQQLRYRKKLIFLEVELTYINLTNTGF